MLEIYNKNIVKVQISLTNQWMYNHSKLAQLWKEYLRKPPNWGDDCSYGVYGRPTRRRDIWTENGNCRIGGLSRKYIVVTQIIFLFRNRGGSHLFLSQQHLLHGGEGEGQQMVELNSRSRLRSSYYLLGIVLCGFHIVWPHSQRN